MGTSAAYELAVAAARRPTAGNGGEIDYTELVRLGSLAASSHNTQPWTFTVGDSTIRIGPDFSRRCPEVDPDDAHLFKSLGCAAENIVHGATTQGLRAVVRFDPATHHVVVDLSPDPDCTETELARAIPTRQCTKAPYNGRAMDPETLAAIEAAGTGDGVRMILLTETNQIQAVTEFVNRGNQAQFSDHRFRRELISWIRPNDREALATGDGISSRTSGQPTAPTWLAKRIIPLLVTAKTQIKADTTNIASSAGVGVFFTTDDNEAAWVEAGRCYERFALKSTALDVRHAFINQPIEVPALRPKFEQWLGLNGEHAQLMVRFGTGAPMPFSIRRPLDEVIFNTDTDG